MKRLRATTRFFITATLAAMLMSLMSGCASWQRTRIDPTGQSLFIVDPPPSSLVPQPQPFPGPSPCASPNASAVSITPNTLVVPIGSEVILLAAVRSPEQFLLTNERVEWSIAPGSMGQFVDVGSNWFSDLLFGEFERGRLGPTYAVGTTSRDSFTLTRTPNPANDIPVLAGQAWVALTSSVEGITNVAARAPNAVGFPTNTQTATIRWFDPRRPAVATTPTPTPAAPRRALPTTAVPTAPPITIAPPTAPPPLTPQPLMPTPRPVLDVSIQGPAQATVGTSVVFHILLVNRGTTTAPNLIIRDRFDPGLEHARAQSVIEAELKNFASGTQQTIDIEFRVTRAGRLCHWVEVSDASGILARSQACLTASEPPRPVLPPPITPPPTTPSTMPPIAPGPIVTPPPVTPTAPTAPPQPSLPPLSVQVKSPSAMTVGESGKFSISVANTTGQKLSQVKLALRLDPAWRPTDATEGFQQEGDSFTWTFNLDVNTSKTIDIQCVAEKTSLRTCLRASVSSAEGAKGASEGCTEIREPAKPAPSPVPELKVTAASMRDPVEAGREFTYEVRVTNTGATPAALVALTAKVPIGMTPVALGTIGPTQAALDGQTFRFEPVAEVAPGQTLTYQVRVRASLSGDFSFHAEATARGVSTPFTADVTTKVF